MTDVNQDADEAYDAEDDDEEIIRLVRERMSDPVPPIPMEDVLAEFLAEQDGTGRASPTG